MAFYDIFNGDADGLCALHQLRLAQPREAQLITGVKRDINLLRQVQAGAGDQLSILDISLHENRADLERLLAAGARCEYFDHHYAGEIPRHAGLQAYIDTAPDVCTSLLVDRHLQGRFRLWAVAAAFGDNLHQAALQAAAPLGLSVEQLDLLRRLGESLNYNAYGETIDDLHYPPDDLYCLLQSYADPFDFIANEPVFDVLQAGFADDMAHAEEIAATLSSDTCALFILPNAAWARRINGVFANQLARQSPSRAHAVLVRNDSGFVVSVRAPVANPTGADALCRQFAGGGRQAAAGINHLPEARLDEFSKKFEAAYAGATNPDDASFR